MKDVEAGSTINTDEHRFYKALDGEYRHKTVKHAATYTKKAEYWRNEGDEVVTTNFVESSFSLLRRAGTGTFHNISRHHLHLYVAEFDARFNRRRITDGERTVHMLTMAKGKRLTYRAIRGQKMPATPEGMAGSDSAVWARNLHLLSRPVLDVQRGGVRLDQRLFDSDSISLR
jgi:ISXO2-like transposase domain